MTWSFLFRDCQRNLIAERTTLLSKAVCNLALLWGSLVAEWLERSSLVMKVPGSKCRLRTGFFKIALFTKQKMGTWLSSELGKVWGGEGEEWRPTSVIPLPGISWLLNSHLPDFLVSLWCDVLTVNFRSALCWLCLTYWKCPSSWWFR